MIVRLLLVLVFTLAVGCMTTDTALQKQGRNDSYIMGFHDGRHSGMRAAGNNFEHFAQDRTRYESDEDYQRGWLAGEEEGRKIQGQADSVGEAAAAGITADTGHKKSKHPGVSDKSIKDATRDVDTSVLKNL